MANRKPTDCVQNTAMTLVATCCGGLILCTFEECHTGPNQYNLKLTCIHKRTFDYLKHALK